MRIAFVTSDEFIAHDADLPLLVEAAGTRGIAAELASWVDPSVEWTQYDLVVVRSCWDYVPRRNEFLAWARSVPRVQNSAATLAWNTDKTYLRELQAAGIAIIETQWSVRTDDALGDHHEWVVKPTISAGSADTARWSTPADVYAHSEQLLAAGRPTMVQPYITSVDDEGETALMYFGGRFSHAIRKGPMLSREHGAHAEPQMLEHITPREPSEAQLAVGADVLVAATEILGEQPLYARVDVVTDAAGDVRLLELELAEPSLFLNHTETGATNLLDAIEKQPA